jgi:hypothetical protein
MKPCCKVCRYWQGPIAAHERYCPPEDVLAHEWGVCRRHAPRPAVETVENARGKSFVAVWPETRATDVCGDFKLLPLAREEGGA